MIHWKVRMTPFLWHQHEYHAITREKHFYPALLFITHCFCLISQHVVHATRWRCLVSFHTFAIVWINRSPVTIVHADYYELWWSGTYYSCLWKEFLTEWSQSSVFPFCWPLSIPVISSSTHCSSKLDRKVPQIIMIIIMCHLCDEHENHLYDLLVCHLLFFQFVDQERCICSFLREMWSEAEEGSPVCLCLSWVILVTYRLIFILRMRISCSSGLSSRKIWSLM